MANMFQSVYKSGHKEYDVYISYAVHDQLWVDSLCKKLEDNRISVYWNTQELLGDISNEKYDTFLSQCSLYILVFSSHYVMQNFLWKRFLPFTKKTLINTVGQNSVKGLLDTKSLLCIQLSSCNMPEQFNEELVMDFTNGDVKNQHWKKLLKFIENIKQRRLVRNLLLSSTHPFNRHISEATVVKSSDDDRILQQRIIESSKDGGLDESKLLSLGDALNEVIENSIKEFDDEIVEKSEAEDIFENNLNLSPEYKNKITPHLLVSKFNAEDDDLTKKHLETLVLKMEDVESILFIDDQDERLMGCDRKNKYKSFSSQYEQMQMMDILQNEFERVNLKAENCTDVVRRRCYRRLLQIYNKCIMSAINGKKETELLESLPNIGLSLKEEEATSIVCCCCESMFHSERALNIHINSCVSDTWRILLKN